VPLATVLDEEVPLADIPDEAALEVEIFDDLIPLADVPATGDISIIWYGATLLSLAGLLVLSLLGRKKTQED
jgi:hypothetical protein